MDFLISNEVLHIKIFPYLLDKSSVRVAQMTLGVLRAKCTLGRICLLSSGFIVKIRTVVIDDYVPIDEIMELNPSVLFV